VGALRCLPLQLSGGAVRANARASTRVRGTVPLPGQHHAVHAESDGRMGAIMHTQWGAEQLTAVSIVAAEARVPPTDDGVASSALRGQRAERQRAGGPHRRRRRHGRAPSGRGGHASDSQAPGAERAPKNIDVVAVDVMAGITVLGIEDEHHRLDVAQQLAAEPGAQKTNHLELHRLRRTH
jgi:hypothetical protein